MAKRAKTARTATKKAAKGKPGKGTRYSTEEKQEITAFVAEVNAAKGRGGVAAAARKYGVSPLSIGNWLRKGDARASAPKARKAGKRFWAKSGRGGVLSELTSLNGEIAKKRSELEGLEARFDNLKSSL